MKASKINSNLLNMVEHCVGTAEQGRSFMMQKLVAAVQLCR
ncbi:hypothetical protein [Leptolyngbya sp. FACHB-541]|nr:hypothetical protein [Leptolyngbya sp. FACHB-541]